jgi:hypothetical protein
MSEGELVNCSLQVAKETLIFRRTQVKTLLATIHVAFVGCHGNLVYLVVSWIPVLGNLWEVPVESSHSYIPEDRKLHNAKVLSSSPFHSDPNKPLTLVSALGNNETLVKRNFINCMKCLVKVSNICGFIQLIVIFITQ